MNLSVNLAGSRELATVLEESSRTIVCLTPDRRRRRRRRGRSIAKMAAATATAATELQRNTKFLASCQDDSKGRQSGYMASTAAVAEAHRVRTLDLPVVHSVYVLTT
jgi:hypothetical protein